MLYKWPVNEECDCRSDITSDNVLVPVKMTSPVKMSLPLQLEYSVITQPKVRQNFSLNGNFTKTIIQYKSTSIILNTS